MRRKNNMLDIKITNKECEKMYFEGNSDELMNQLEFVVASVLLTMIEQGGFDREDLENILDTFANNVEATIDNIEKFADRFRKLC